MYLVRYFRVGSTDIRESFVTELKSKGVTFFVDTKTTAWGQRVAYFKDPDGNIWELGDDEDSIE